MTDSYGYCYYTFCFLKDKIENMVFGGVVTIT